MGCISCFLKCTCSCWPISTQCLPAPYDLVACIVDHDLGIYVRVQVLHSLCHCQLQVQAFLLFVTAFE